MINNTVSDSIKYLRFPLSAMVVLEHYYPNKVVQIVSTDSIDVYTPFARFLSIYLPTFAVPIFFMMSGYLFFYSFKEGNSFDLVKYRKKLYSRCKTLLIPYLLWNLIMLLLMMLVQYFTHDKIMPLEKSISDINCIDIICSFWSISEKGFPIDGPLWFIRDLMVILLFSPIIYYLVKKTRTVGVLGLSILYLAGIDFNLTYFPRTALYYVALGGYFALSNTDMLLSFCKLDRRISLFVIIMSLLMLLFATFNGFPKYRMDQLCGIYSLIMTIFLWSPVAYLTNNKFCTKSLTYLSVPSFFIYASHKPVIYGLCIVIFALISPSSNFTLCLLCLFVPVVVILLCLIVYFVIKKYVPFLRCLNGFRL